MPGSSRPASTPRRPDTGCRRSGPSPASGSRGIARSASATCGPGRATPPDAATIASTGRASCCPGSATAHRVVANGTNGRRNSAASFACFIPTTRCTGRSDHDRRCSARTIPAPGLWPPSSHSSQSAGNIAASRPCSRCSRAGHSACGDAAQASIASPTTRASPRSRCRRCRAGTRLAAMASAGRATPSRRSIEPPRPDMPVAIRAADRRTDACGRAPAARRAPRAAAHRSPPARPAS